MLGRAGEIIARRYLERRGWRILVANYRFGRREIDIIAEQGRVIAFVEVKSRRCPAGSGFPEEAVTWVKRKGIEVVARDFLYRRGLRDVDVRFDVIAVDLSTGGSVSCVHLEDAWRPGWR